MRTIKKCGGLDEYLLGEKPGRIKELGMEGWRLRWELLQTREVRKRYAGEREKLGLPPSVTVVELKDGTVTTKEALDEEWEASKRIEKEVKIEERRRRRKELARERAAAGDASVGDWRDERDDVEAGEFDLMPLNKE